MDLNTVWFIIVTVLFIGFFFLEGFDYGVGMLLPFLAKEDQDRRAIINTIGPVWDGNEVWMLTAGGAMFASFPHVYATLFSGAYLALLLMLLSLIIRGVAFEFRSKRDDQIWRTRWDWAIFIGSILPAFLWGVTVGNLMQGFAIDAEMNYSGGLLPMLNPFSLWSGVVFVGLFLMHGANFLSIKLHGEFEAKAKAVAFKAWIFAMISTVMLLIWEYFATDILDQGIIPAGLAAVAMILTGVYIRQGKSAMAFLMGSLAIVLATVMVFAGLFPRIMISTLNPEWSLTIYNASSSQYTLKVMTILALIFVPIVLAYQYWTYYVFRHRISGKSADLVY
jgi:cytochrome d ubiquinol oxidase subunit II